MDHPSRPALPVARVLVLAPTPFFGDRGCHVRIYEQARHVRELGVEPLIVTYTAGRDVPGLSIARSPALPGLAPSALGPSWSRPILDAALTTTAVREARRFKPDVIHAHLHEGIAVGVALRAFTRVPLIADLQGSLTEELIDHRFLKPSGMLTALTRRFEAWLTMQPDRIVVSSLTASGLVLPKTADPEVLEPLPDGVDVERFRPGLATDGLRQRFGLPGKRVIVFLGVLTQYQGVDALLDAMTIVRRTQPDAHLLLMGYPNEEHYRGLVQERGLGDVVTLTGRVAYEDAPAWIGLGDVAVSAKQSLTEANGKLLNYMACGLATVATDTPVNRELLGDAGVYVPVGRSDELATALVRLLTTPAERDARGRTLRARAESDFSWPALARRLVGLYADVAGAVRRPAA